ncbi:plasmid conjugal transfer protein TrbD/VirB3 [Candidatus Rickettsiella viridis]|uniref:Plasmid conjugal transfer protein TrbD/VirB3 n=1 Tax=Candidatus Rickettsiella viridis TaxID=676208 RepID=A0A2Z5UWU4_9COXI|nr:VirB3 family type IV secretion system protein [Candidatus Rickettsiella viridis]BBB14773.1 type IV secretory systen protein VirB3 [Candidatus Rickettsiella viridis]BBB15503.1 plasmid conjugal transfer protein TrbD/VirB3 [Candidatus Rickettsiella viridis]
MSKDYQLEVDPLALALTRPPLFMGVPMRLFFANLAINMMLCIDLHTLIGIPLFGLVHLILFRLTMKDLQFFRVWLKYLTQTPPVLNHSFWGGTNSYQLE